MTDSAKACRHFLGRWIVGIVAATSAIDTSAARASEMTLTPGVWQSVGYGWVFDVEGNFVRTYHLGRHGCWPNTDPDVEALWSTLKGPQSRGASRFSAGTTQNVTVSSFERLPQLPQRCRQPAATADPIDTFDAFIDAFEEHYAFSRERHVNWASIRHRYRAHVSHHASDSELFAVLSAVVDGLSDRHVALDAGAVGYAVSGLDAHGVSVAQSWRPRPGGTDFWSAYLAAQAPYKSIVDSNYVSDLHRGAGVS